MLSNLKQSKTRRFPFCISGFKSILINIIILTLSFLFILPGFAAQIRVAWDSNTEPDFAGYEVYYGTTSGTYGTPVDVGNVTSYTILNLTAGQVYYVALKAYDTSRNKSGFSNEVYGTATDLGQTYTMTVNTNPLGLQVVVDGTAYTSPQTFNWVAGSSHNVAVASPQGGTTGTRYVFASWSDSGAPSHTITTPSANATYTASFITQFSLATNVNSSNGGLISPSGTNWYDSGQNVSVTATATSGYSFISWTGNLSGTTNPGLVTMNGSKSVNANFAIQSALSVTSSNGLNASGKKGGPFRPTSQTYTLQNTGGTSIDWSASKGQTWVTLSAASGTLAPGGSTTVTVSLNSNTNSLTTGIYSDTITIRNNSTGSGNTSRAVGLSISRSDAAAGNNKRIIDFDKDGKTDIAVWRPTNGYWYIIRSSDGQRTVAEWGEHIRHDVPVPGDYDGDGITDIAVWRPGSGHWLIIRSSDGQRTVIEWGEGVRHDVPVPGDYDGDGITDIAVWRPTNGYWYIIRSSDGQRTVAEWGEHIRGDVPVPGDYDGDGITDIAVWRPGSGHWLIIRSSDGQRTAIEWGEGVRHDVPVPGDYDGDGITDIAVWRPTNGYWYIIRSSDGQRTVAEWGEHIRGDVPVPGDYDGDGITDIAVWRPGSGHWLIIRSSDGQRTAIEWGEGRHDDVPLTY